MVSEAENDVRYRPVLLLSRPKLCPPCAVLLKPEDTFVIPEGGRSHTGRLYYPPPPPPEMVDRIAGRDLPRAGGLRRTMRSMRSERSVDIEVYSQHFNASTPFIRGTWAPTVT